MTHENDTSPAEAPRRAWAAPRVRHLKTSGAEFGAGATLDAEGMS